MVGVLLLPDITNVPRLPIVVGLVITEQNCISPNKSTPFLSSFLMMKETMVDM